MHLLLFLDPIDRFLSTERIDLIILTGLIERGNQYARSFVSALSVFPGIANSSRRIDYTGESVSLGTQGHW